MKLSQAATAVTVFAICLLLMGYCTFKFDDFANHMDHIEDSVRGRTK